MVTFDSVIIDIISSILVMVYIAIQVVGVWNASKEYKGKLAWAFYAKLSIALLFIFVAKDLYVLFLK
jgi:hypothetical protein